MGYIGCGRYILWIDQAEYYVVCADCYYQNADSQWSGFTEVCRQKDPVARRVCWENYKRDVYEWATTVEKCEFCGRPFPKWDDTKCRRWWRND